VGGLAAHCATSLFATSSLSLTLLATLFDAWFLVESSSLEFLPDPFAGHFSLEAADSPADVVVVNDDFEGAQLIAFACGHVSRNPFKSKHETTRTFGESWCWARKYGAGAERGGSITRCHGVVKANGAPRWYPRLGGVPLRWP